MWDMYRSTWATEKWTMVNGKMVLRDAHVLVHETYEYVRLDAKGN